MSVTAVRIERSIDFRSKESSPSNADQSTQAPTLSIPSKGGYRQTPIQKQARAPSSLLDNNMMVEHKKLGNQTGPAMVHAVQIKCLGAIVGTLLLSNGDSLSKRRQLNGQRVHDFSPRQRAVNKERTSFVSTTDM